MCMSLRSLAFQTISSLMASSHVTILPVPGLGHLIPLLELAKRLVTFHSYHVTFLLIPNEAQSAFLDSTTFPSAISFIHLSPVDPSVFGDIDILSLLTIAIRHLSSEIESAILSESRKTVLLIDFFATEALDIARKLSIPTYVFHSSTAAHLSFMIYLPVLDREVNGKYTDLPEPIKLPGCTPIRPEDVCDPVRDRKSSFYSSFFYNSVRLCKADGILVNTCRDLEPITLKALRENLVFKQMGTPRVFPVGPLVRNRETLVENECTTWLGKQPADSVLFISFGSAGYLSGQQISELAHGLELSGKRFIWVLRRPTIPIDVSGNALDLSDPLGYLPEGFLNRTNGIGMVLTTWAPQVEILSHTSTGAFLSHCGWNSTLESVTNGVPMITWPLFAEQKMNATMLVNEVGAAVRLTVMKRDEIEKVVRLVMEGEEGERLRTRVKELQQSALRGLEEGGDSYNSLSQAVEEWKGVTVE